MNEVNKTLYIPLFGKSYVSKKGIILDDKKAEEIWKNENFKLKRKSKSKWLAYYLSMRSAVFDLWVKEKNQQYQDCIILHLGCGLDSRFLRIKSANIWFDVDFPSVIEERKLHYIEKENYKMLSADIKEPSFINSLPQANTAIIILEGVSMYIENKNLQTTLAKLSEKFSNLSVLVDCYTPFAVKMSKLKNPIKEVGIKQVFGIKHPSVLEKDTGLTFVKEHSITPTYLIDELKGFEKFIFKTLYAGKISKKLYKLYEYES